MDMSSTPKPLNLNLMKNFSNTLSVFTLGLATATANAHTFDAGRVDAHAPISIMGDHTHAKGEWMLSYRYMHMEMDGMRNGTDAVIPAEVFAANYTISPDEMTMGMHMVGVMYAPTDKLTLAAMANYLDIEMDHLIFPMAAPLLIFNGGSDRFTTKTSGLGDLKLNALYSVFNDTNTRIHVGLGLSLPTGSITEKDTIPAPAMGDESGMGGLFNRQLPAPMQLGSGTWDILPSVTWLEQREGYSFGAQASGTLRTGRNDQGYRLGHQFKATTWAALPLHESFNLSAGLAYQWDGKMRGQQEDLLLNPPFAPMRETVPTAFSENYGRQKIEVILGAGYLFVGDFLQGHRLAFDVRLPLWRDLNGYQMETDWVATLGWQKAW
jgi:hypothetical protein